MQHRVVVAKIALTPWSRRLTTVFPSTTPIALTSLGTGLTPGEHGITLTISNVRPAASKGRFINIAGFEVTP